MDISFSSWLPARGVARYGVLLGALAVLGACKSKTDANGSGQPAEFERSSGPVSLTLIGFNYTDLSIDNFSVNGQGGGNIFVSTPTSGGGGSVCCVGFSAASELPIPVKIRWTRDRKRWCEKEVLITGPVPAAPEYLAVHFYPDGRIDAEITQQYPSVKLQLEEGVNPDERKPSGNTVADEQTARCTNDRF